MIEKEKPMISTVGMEKEQTHVSFAPIVYDWVNSLHVTRKYNSSSICYWKLALPFYTIVVINGINGKC
jgi:hypothetical protein